MSTENKDPYDAAPDALQSVALRILKNRAERLVRLLDLKAPPVIIANEVRLVMDAAIAFTGESWGFSVVHSAMARLKPRMGFCSQTKCENPLPPPDKRHPVHSRHVRDVRK